MPPPEPIEGGIVPDKLLLLISKPLLTSSCSNTRLTGANNNTPLAQHMRAYTGPLEYCPSMVGIVPTSPLELRPMLQTCGASANSDATAAKQTEKQNCDLHIDVRKEGVRVGNGSTARGKGA